MENGLYHNVTNLSKEAAYRMYMKYEKEELARMLVERDLQENKTFPYNPYINESKRFVCRKWSDCTNPHMDCIDCPLRNIGGSRDWIPINEACLEKLTPNNGTVTYHL